MNLLIFDLDGTLIDSRLDLANAVNAALQHLGRPPLPVEQVAAYVGNGAPVLVRRALGDDATQAQCDQALAYFLDFYRRHALDCTKLYPGVRESLDRLAAAGKRLAVLTNKPTPVSQVILEGLGVAALFFRIYGGDSFASKKPDPIGVTTLMREAGIGPDRTMVVGDSSVDVATARNAGVSCCGVTYGLQPDSLDDPPPDLRVDRLEQMVDWVLSA